MSRVTLSLRKPPEFEVDETATGASGRGSVQPLVAAIATSAEASRARRRVRRPAVGMDLLPRVGAGRRPEQHDDGSCCGSRPIPHENTALQSYAQSGTGCTALREQRTEPEKAVMGSERGAPRPRPLSQRVQPHSTFPSRFAEGP